MRPQQLSLSLMAEVCVTPQGFELSMIIFQREKGLVEREFRPLGENSMCLCGCSSAALSRERQEVLEEKLAVLS